MDSTVPPPCTLTSLELSILGSSDPPLDPCLLYDEGPAAAGDTDDGGAAPAAASQVVTLIQVTPNICKNHRDGAVAAVSALNAANGEEGISVGAASGGSNSNVQFRLVSAVAGNSNALPSQEYAVRHERVLSDLLAAHASGAAYIIGSCSFAAESDKAPALAARRIVLAQIGPPGFYQSDTAHAYTFGMHVDSDTYPLAAVRELNLRVVAESESSDPADQPVRVVYRDRSEFFYSTCRSAIDEATSQGFDVTAIEYNPEADDDGNGQLNFEDVAFLQGLADQACPPPDDESSIAEPGPALFACVLSELEANTLLDRWGANGCRPAAVWLTTATWGWASSNQDRLPHLLGGGQWHHAMSYADEYFESGQALLDHTADLFGYAGDYNTVVSYAIPMVFAQNLQATFRLDDSPDVLATLATDEGYDRLVQTMVRLDVDTIYGPVRFNQYQRNSGRGGAATQWDSSGKANQLVAPLDQAEVSMTMPAPSGELCAAGSYLDEALLAIGSPLLESNCSPCPAGTYTDVPNHDMTCLLCPNGSTSGLGATSCDTGDGGTGTTNTALIAGLVGGIGGAIILLLAYLIYRSHKLTAHMAALEKEGRSVPQRVSSVARLQASFKPISVVADKELEKSAANE
mmetsp:Transcript_17634/g.41658  ORF Transcript_17634/g.41658 Transcript_17634/m.41658 type:complete len:631 (-) Transcript_17634:171-2063(-)